MENKLKNFFLANRLEKIVTENQMVNLAIKLAEELGGYIGGSRRFGLNRPKSDIDVFFLTTNREGWEMFSKFLACYGSQDYFTTPVWGIEKVTKGKERYKNLRVEEVRVQTGTETHYMKGKYSLRGMNFDVSLVDIFMSPEEEAEIYIKRINKTLVREGKYHNDKKIN